MHRVVYFSYVNKIRGYKNDSLLYSLPFIEIQKVRISVFSGSFHIKNLWCIWVVELNFKQPCDLGFNVIEEP